MQVISVAVPGCDWIDIPELVKCGNLIDRAKMLIDIMQQAFAPLEVVHRLPQCVTVAADFQSHCTCGHRLWVREDGHDYCLHGGDVPWNDGSGGGPSIDLYALTEAR